MVIIAEDLIKELDNVEGEIIEIPNGYKLTELGLIPKDWETKKLSEISTIVRGGSPRPAGDPKYFNGNYIPWLTVIDEWKKNCIGEIFQFLSTANNPRSDLSEHGDIGYLHYGDIHGGTSPFLDCSKKAMPYIELQKIKNLPFLEEGDLVIADASEDYEGIGKSVEMLNINNKKIVAGLHTFLLRGNKSIVADGFKGYIQFIPSLRTDIVRLATGISVYGISKNNLRGVEVKLPPIHEQKAIAAVLSDIDSLITSLKQLIAKKRDIKQAAMEQLLTGKQRLPGFTGDWDKKRLGDIAFCYSGGTPPTSNLNYYNGDIPWITSGDLNQRYIKKVKGRITELGLNNSSAQLVKKDSLLIALYGATAGVTAITKIDAAINQAILAVIPKNDHVYFLFHYFELRKNWLINTYTQGGQPNLSGDIVKGIEFYIPAIKEQIAVAKILSDMDDEISSLEQQLDKTQNLKQGMMQELLTGRIRLV
jgi:type I restriction enzyme S subunit